MSDSTDPLIGRRLGGRYAIENKLSQGTFGTVYRAKDVETGREVAVKVLAPRHGGAETFEASRARFMREARAMAQMDSPYAVRLLDCGEEGDGLIFLVQELLDGRALESVLANEGALPVSRSVEIATQVLQALQDAHGRGIVHRDITPANIMMVLGPDGRETVRVLDFGLARILEEDQSGKRITRAGLTLGTPTYMAPEQVQHKEIGPPTDVYAVGVLLHQMIMGRLPFTGASAIAIMSKHMNEPAPAATAAPEGLQQVILKALEKSPGDRYPHAGAFRAALSPFYGAVGTPVVVQHDGEATPIFATAVISSGVPEADPEVAAEKATNLRLVVLVGLLLAGSLGALGALYLSGQGGQTPVPTAPTMMQLGWTVDRGVLDAYAPTDSAARAALRLVVEDLIAIGPDGEVQPRAVQTWKVAEDRTSIDLKLAEGVMFHPHRCTGEAGRAATPKDLAWSLGYARKQGVGSLATIAVDRIETHREGWVRLVYSHPMPHPIAAISAVRLLPAGLDTCDTPRAFRQPLGSGPYRFTEAATGEMFTLTVTEDPRFAEWARPGTVTLRPVADAIAGVSAVAGGTLDALRLGLDRAVVADVKAATPALHPSFEGAALAMVPIKTPGVNQFGLLFTGQGPQDAVEMRRAVAMAIDRAQAIERHPSALDPQDRLLEPRMAGYDPALTPLAYNRDAARELVEGLRKTSTPLAPLLLGTLPRDQAVAETVVDQLRAANIKAVLRVIAPEELGGLIEQKQLDGLFVSLSDALVGTDPLPFVRGLGQLVRTALGTPDPAIDGWLRDASSNPDAAQRSALYGQIERRLLELMPYVPIGALRPGQPSGVAIIAPRLSEGLDAGQGIASEALLRTLIGAP